MIRRLLPLLLAGLASKEVTACGAVRTTTTPAPIECMCNPGLVNVTPQNPARGEKAFDADVVTVMNSVCTRRLECRATGTAVIEINNGMLGAIVGDPLNFKTVTLTCMDGGWFRDIGTPEITAATCAAI